MTITIDGRLFVNQRREFISSSKLYCTKFRDFFFIDGPWEIIKATSREAVRLYRAIPPVNEWPSIISRAVISMAKGIGRFLVALGKAVKATPKAIYKTGKYILKHTWEGIKAIPHLVKFGAEKLWSGVKIIATWLKDFFLRYRFLILTYL